MSPSTGAEQYASYGFSKHAVSSQGVEILKNKYSLGLGCTFTDYMTESEWLELDYHDREQALLECVVLPDSADSQMHHLAPDKISSGSRKVSYQFSQSANMTANNKPMDQKKRFPQQGQFQVNENNGSVTLHLKEELPDHELYLYFQNLKRKPDSMRTAQIQTRIDLIRSKLSGSDRADHGSYTLTATMGEVTKRGLNLVEDIQGFSDVENIMIHLGQYQEKHREIQISFDEIGSYTYDSISVLAVPLSTYKTKAQSCMDHALQINHFSDNEIRGSVTTDTAHSMLYLSIPFHAGWKAYVDGVETNTQNIDIAFTGIPINQAGNHDIKLRYRPVGFHLGLVCFIIGTILCIFVLVLHHRRNRHEKTLK